MSSKFLNANTDVTLSENSDLQIPSQKAVKTYVDNKTGVLATKEELTTVTNQIGDQVSVIEAKIPINAYTEDNLIAGNDIEIVPEPVEANFDEHTLACFHFENNFDNEITGSPVGVSNTAGSFTQDYKKFGQYSLAGGPCITVTHSVDNNDFTTDAWVFLNNNYAWHPIEVGTISITPNNGGWDVSGDGINKRYVPDIYLNTWMHVAVVRKTMVYYVFFNGKLTAVSDVSSTVNNTLFSWQANSFYYALDELRISDVARWTEDFNPPTQAYPIAVPTGNYVVRNKTKLVHQSDVGIANGVASLDASGKVPAEQISVATTSTPGGVKPDGDTITVTEDGTISAVGGSGSGDTIGLSIGDVVFSYSNLASENPGKLPLFTGEIIASANTIYPEFYNWVSSHTELQCTSEEYEASLTTYGECAKYVIGGGSLRLPLIKNYIKAANTAEGIKNIEAGLPDHNHTVSGSSNWGSLSPTGNAVALVTQVTTSNASESNSIYGKSSTVTPASTTLYPWVVAYTAAVPASTAQAAEFQQGLSGKADTNLGNLSAAGKDLASGLGMPSNRYIDLTLGASGSTYTAPANGYFIIRKNSTGSAQAFYFHNKTSSMSTYIGSHIANWEMDLSINAKKGDIVEIFNTLGGATIYFRFIYAEGAE